METLLEEFTAPTGGVVRVVMIDGEPWFVAKDVCDILETRTNNLRNILDDDEVQEFSNDYSIVISESNGKAPLIISEPGLYSLVLKSRKEEAKAFKRWVTHEVLPTIRKTGMYGGPRTLQESLRAYADLLDANERNAKLALEAQAKVAELADSVLATEAQRDKAISERARINSSRSGKCLRKVRTANEEKRKVEEENTELKIRLGEVADWQTVVGMDNELSKHFILDKKVRQKVGKTLTYVSKKLGVQIKKVADARYGEVNAYHVKAWKAFFEALAKPSNASFLYSNRKYH